MAFAVTVLFLLFFILPTIVFSLSTTCVHTLTPRALSHRERERESRSQCAWCAPYRRFVGSTLHALFRNNRLKDDSYTPLPHKVATSDAASDDMV